MGSIQQHASQGYEGIVQGFIWDPDQRTTKVVMRSFDCGSYDRLRFENPLQVSIVFSSVGGFQVKH